MSWQTTPCVPWQGHLDKLGYGKHRSGRPAHRVLYEKTIGPIPENLTIDHLCRNPSCVNLDHLEPVTNRENILRGTSPAAKNAQKDVCAKGHPFDTANTYLAPGNKKNRHSDPRRQCRACNRLRVAEYKARKAKP